MFFGFNPLYKERFIKIEFVMDCHESISIDRVKELLINKILMKPSGRFMIEIFGSIQKLKSKIEQKNDIKDLINLFLYDE